MADTRTPAQRHYDERKADWDKQRAAYRERFIMLPSWEELHGQRPPDLRTSSAVPTHQPKQEP